ncbi:LysR family transcriptional regulator [Williamsia sp.]|uniref:LysR family transcriptional regulator n=1 Tax=Williamsia sp. TaxID=1872085 RepID=UPI002F949743
MPPSFPSIDLRRLDYFVKAVEAPTLKVAAQQLHMTQQALSSAIRQLETEIGVPLFTRTGRTLVVTPAGQELYTRALPLLAGGEQVIRAVRTAAQEKPAPFMIGHTQAISSEEVYRIIEPLATSDPDLQFTAVSLYPNVIRPRLFDGTIDFALRRGVHSPPDQASSIIAYHELRLAVSSSHPLARRGTVTMADIASHPILVWAPRHHSFYTDFLVSHCRRAGFDPQLIVNPVQGTPPRTAVIAHPTACAFVTDPAGSAYDGRVTVIDFEDPPLAPVQALWLPHTTSPMRERILAAARERLPMPRLQPSEPDGQATTD